MPSVKLTAVSVRDFKPFKSKRREIADATGPGLTLIIQTSGIRSWALRFRDARGKSVKLTIGRVDTTADKDLASEETPQVGSSLTLADARLLAGMLDRERARGVDIVGKYAGKNRKRAIDDNASAAFKPLAMEFFRNHKTKRGHQRPRRWRADAHLLGLDWKRDDDPMQNPPIVRPKSLCDVWGNRPVSQITRHEIEAIVQEAKGKNIPGLPAKNKDFSENRGRKLFAVLSVYFSWLAKRRYVDIDPTVNIEAPHAPKARNRILSGPELRWAWLAAGDVPAPHGPVVRMLLLCGQRLNETGGMRWGELNCDASVWRIPGERTKNHREHLLPLPVAARDIVNAMPRIEGRDLVFSVGGKSAPSNWGDFKHLLDARMADIAHKERGKAIKIEHWVLHDLRRSFASGLQHVGVRSEVIEKALNHSSGTFAGVSGTYQRDPLTDDVRAALSSWSRYLQMVSDSKLHAAHEKFLHQGEDDERARNLAYFRDCVGAGGERWKAYHEQLRGKSPENVTELRRGKR